MSRKHKSNRKPKITQTNVPAPASAAKKQAENKVEKNNVLPENHSETTTIENKPSETLEPIANSQPHSSDSDLKSQNNAPENNDAEYTLDEHYAQQENTSLSGSESHVHQQDTKVETETPVSGSQNDSETVSLSEYEQLKRKNRRRLVGAGALVLVAGSLFAAASKDNSQSPKLTAVKPVEQTVHQPEILRPAGSENKIDLSMDNEKNTPLVLKNNMVASQQPAASQNSKPKTATAPTSKPSNTQSNEDKAKAREEARLAEERRQKVQSKVAEAETKRLEAEKSIANKAKIAQANADKNRNAERAQLTAERAAEEKQRAQRQATASKANTSSGSSKASSIQAGAFADKDAARRMQQQLKDLNYNARLEEVQTNKGKVYRVRTENFANETEARNALNKLQNKGVNGMLVGK